MLRVVGAKEVACFTRSNEGGYKAKKRGVPKVWKVVQED
jgi:hypothetical protein